MMTPLLSRENVPMTSERSARPSVIGRIGERALVGPARLARLLTEATPSVTDLTKWAERAGHTTLNILKVARHIGAGGDVLTPDHSAISYEEHDTSPAESAPEQLPYIEKRFIWNGQSLQLRTLDAMDESAYRWLYDGLDSEDVYCRFMGGISDAGQAAVDRSGVSWPDAYTTLGVYTADGSRLVGEATYFAATDRPADFSYVVAPDYRGRSAEGSAVLEELFSQLLSLMDNDPRITEICTELLVHNHKSLKAVRQAQPHLTRFAPPTIVREDDTFNVRWGLK